jgi:hypothetical protein
VGAAAQAPPAPAPAAETLEGREAAAADRPLLPAGVAERFVAPRLGAAGEVFVHRPALLGRARLHYASARDGVDHWEERTLLAPLREPVGPDPWEDAARLDAPPALGLEPAVPGKFAPVPSLAAREKSYASWGKKLASNLYRTEPLVLFKHRALRRTSEPGQSEADFRAELQLALREARDLEVEKLRKRYAPRLARLEDRIRRAEHKVEVQREQVQEKKLAAAVSLGSTVLGALFGRRARSVGTVGRAATTARAASRIGRERADVERAEERVADLQQQLQALSDEFEDSVAEIETPVDPAAIELEEKTIRPRKSDLEVEPVALVWTPWAVSPEGTAEPAY